MRIVHLINNLGHIGGAELALLRLLEGRGEDDGEHRVVALLEADRLGPRFESIGVPVHALALARGGRFGATVPGAGRAPGGFMRRLLPLLRGPAPDLYVGWMYFGNLAASALGSWHGVPALWNVRHSLHDDARSGRSVKLALSLSTSLSLQPRRIVFNSARSARQHIARGWPRERSIVVHAGTDTTRYRDDEELRTRARANLGVDLQTPLLGRFGRDHPLKGHDLLLHAFAQLPALADVRAPVLVLGGREVDESNTRLVALRDALGLAGRVRLLGECDDLPALLPAFDLCVSSSHSESFPNVVAEAMACGVPCVVTDVGESAAVVGDTGWTVPPGDAAQLARALGDAIAVQARNPGSRRAAARARIVANFSATSTVAAYARLYRDCIDPAFTSDRAMTRGNTR